MSNDDIDVGFLIKNSYLSIKKDPAYIMLFIFPVAVYTLLIVHMWFIWNDIILLYQTIQSPTVLIDFFQDQLLIIILLIIVYGIIELITLAISISGLINKLLAQQSGGRLSFSDALSIGIKQSPRVFAAIFIGILIISVPFFVFYVLIINIVNILFLFPLIIVLLFFIPIFWIYIYFRISFFIQICIIENIGPLNCFKKSWHLTRGNVLLIFVTGLILGIIGIVIVIPFNIGAQVGVPLFSWIGSLVVSIILGPLSILTFTYLYFGLLKGKNREIELALNF